MQGKTIPTSECLSRPHRYFRSVSGHSCNSQECEAMQPFSFATSDQNAQVKQWSDLNSEVTTGFPFKMFMRIAKNSAASPSVKSRYLFGRGERNHLVGVVALHQAFDVQQRHGAFQVQCFIIEQRGSTCTVLCWLFSSLRWQKQECYA